MFNYDDNCSVNSVQRIIKKTLINSKQSYQSYTSNMHTILNFYLDLFYDRSLQMLIQISILFTQNSLLKQSNRISMIVVKNDIERLLNELLNKYVDLRSQGLEKRCLLSRNEYFKCAEKIKREKLKSLNEKSLEIVYKREKSLIKKHKILHKN